MESHAFTWIAFYEEFASKLLPYKEDREKLIEKIRNVFERAKMPLPTLDKENYITDIDPFTIFGLFNKGITDANRIKLAESIKAEFGIAASVPSDFNGVPVLDNRRAFFYHWRDERQSTEMDNLWRAFTSAIQLAESDTEGHRQRFTAAYDAVRAQKGIKWNLTMGLYWIRPQSFISFDSRNRDFIKANRENLPAGLAELNDTALPDAKAYLSMRDALLGLFAKNGSQYKSFPDFSYASWIWTNEKPSEKWTPANYTPNITTNDWHTLLADKDIFNGNSLAIMKRLLDYGGEATCSQLAAKYGETANFYNSGSVALARRIAEKTNCPVPKRDDGTVQWWAILYEGRNANKEDSGSFVWKLRGELREALEQTDLQTIPLYTEAPKGTIRYWLYAPGHGAEKWDEFYNDGIMGLGWDDIGDLSVFESKEAMIQEMKIAYGEDKRYTNAALATWQFSHEMKPGDIVFVKRGRLGEILGRGIVKSEYQFDAARNDGYKYVLRADWTHKGTWTLQDKQLPMKTLTDITSYTGLVKELCNFFDDEDGGEQPAISYPPYTADNFLSEVYMTETQYHSLAARLRKKKNIILQGAPGVGKTFAAKRLAYSLMGEKDAERVMVVQFHQSYSYEDFIMGFRPTENGFQLQTGAFYNFCKKAADDSENDYYFIIDEINRGNLNKIFGELFLLLEADKRGEEVQLLYKDEKFSVPPNLYLIGTMNTADRSLAMLDYALRRRFSFFDMAPGFETKGFKAYQAELSHPKLDRLVQCVERLNAAIAEDETLGEGFCIGHSYFCGLKPEEMTDETFSAIVEYDILPLIKE
ncbi:MAG: AAA family ATPase, partial [Schwartzia sp.]|nr:AAA family ATPase [Schwartzia sp. (in: firmicutes)]